MYTLTIVLLVLLICNFSVQSLLTRWQISHTRKHQEKVPDKFAHKIPLDAHRKAAKYTQEKVRLNLVDSGFSSILLLVWTLGGGLEYLDEYWRHISDHQLLVGTGVLMSVLLISSILSLPLSYYRTFQLEQSFGFNCMTSRLFVLDHLKRWLLYCLIGIPICLLVLWMMAISKQHWWWLLWCIWVGFNVLMVWAYPAFIAPLFNKFKPLEIDSLKQRIENLLERNGFKSQGIFVMDGSTRSTHGNAYFTGLGSSKRIVFFDTLIDELSHEEIEAVLAHELGHFKCHHIKKRMLILAIMSFLGCALIGWLAPQLWFYQGLGVSQESHYMALILFTLIAPAFLFFSQPLFSFISRKHEFEADRFAATQTRKDNLINALVSLYRENANTLTPDPHYSGFYDSHPPALTRIIHLEKTV